MTNKKKKLPKKSVKKLSKGKRDILFVQWLDHCKRGYGGSWYSTDEIKKQAMLCESVGFKVHEDDDIVVLALSQDPNDLVGETMHIIKSCIIKRRVIK